MILTTSDGQPIENAPDSVVRLLDSPEGERLIVDRMLADAAALDTHPREWHWGDDSFGSKAETEAAIAAGLAQFPSGDYTSVMGPGGETFNIRVSAELYSADSAPTPEPKRSVWISWSGATPIRYDFDTEGEVNAFLRGISATQDSTHLDAIDYEQIDSAEDLAAWLDENGEGDDAEVREDDGDIDC